MNIKQELLDLIVYQTAVDKDLILTKDSWEDMGIDSLDALEIMLSVSDKFNIVIGVWTFNYCCCIRCLYY